MAFVSGQRVTIVPPSTMAGCHGIVQNPTKGVDAYTVRLDGDTIIIPTAHIVSHHGRTDDEDEDSDDDDLPALHSTWHAGGSSSGVAVLPMSQESLMQSVKIDVLERKVTAMENQAGTFWAMHERAMERIEKIEKRQGPRLHMLEETVKSDAVKILTLEEDSELMQGAMRAMKETVKSDAVKILTLEEDSELMQGAMRAMKEEMSVMRRQFSGMSRDLSAAEGSIHILLRATTQAFR